MVRARQQTGWTAEPAGSWSEDLGAEPLPKIQGGQLGSFITNWDASPLTQKINTKINPSPSLMVFATVLIRQPADSMNPT